MNRLNTVTRIGLDVHGKFSIASFRDEADRVVARERVNHADRVVLRDQLRRWPAGTPVFLEATFGWGWMSDELTAAGLSPQLAHSGKVAAWRKQLGQAKSNRIDADLLAQLPLTGQRWWEVWCAPPEVRQRREWMRCRKALVTQQTGMKNRTHAVLHRHGLPSPFSDLFGAAGRKMLGDLSQPTNPSLPESARATLRHNLRLLNQLRCQIAELTQELRRQVQRDPAAERLCTIPGIGWVLGYTIYAEIGDIARFTSYRKLSSYALLAPRSYDSGEENPDEPPKGRHVGFVGRRVLKWAMIEAAHGAVRRGGRFRAIFDRRTNGGKRDRNRGYIAVAHELIKVIWSMWRNQRGYSETPPTGPSGTDLTPTTSAPPPDASHRDATRNGRAAGRKKASMKDKTKRPRDGKIAVTPKRARPTATNQTKRPKQTRASAQPSRTGDRRLKKPAGRMRTSSRPGTGRPNQPMVVVG